MSKVLPATPWVLLCVVCSTRTRFGPSWVRFKEVLTVYLNLLDGLYLLEYLLGDDSGPDFDLFDAVDL